MSQRRFAVERKQVVRTGKPGRPAYKPTDKDERFLEVCIIGGLAHRDIAKALGISVPTMYKHYQDVIDRSAQKASSKVIQTAFEMAVSGKCPAMTIFWLKTRLQWREKQEVQHTIGTTVYHVTIDGDPETDEDDYGELGAEEDI